MPGTDGMKSSGPDRHTAVRNLLRDERGFTLVFFAVALPALLGVVGLAVDVGRLYTLDTQLAAAVDAAALAAASQLDRSEGAMQRARNAANTLANDTPFANHTDVALTFRFAADLSDLRGSPTFSLADQNAAEAVFVEVTTAPQSLTASFIQMVAPRAVVTRRKAVAESQYYACDVTPLMLCQSDPDAFAAKATRGREYLLRNAATMADGSLTMLDAPGDTGGAGTPRTLASDRPAFCYTDHVTFRPGVTARQFDDAINIRFDRYVNAAGTVAPEIAAFPPAPNVLEGQRYNSCTSPPNAADINPPYHLPRDSAFRRFGATTLYDQGIGDWKTTPAYSGSGSNAATALDEYIYWNHSNKSPLFQESLRASATRYEIYLKELGLDPASEATPVVTQGNASAATMPTGGPKVGSYSSLSEDPIPKCYRGPTAPTDARRRVLYMAIVDCKNFAKNATAAGLSRNVGKFFLVEPANANLIFVEFLNMVKPATDDGRLRHVVQLVQTN